jgi:small subunit ribosomal protein S16
MAVVIRLARGGAKKRPVYRIVAADKRKAAQKNFIEKLGTFNPLLPKESKERFVINADRLKYWQGVGAEISGAVERQLVKLGLAKEDAKKVALRAKSAKRAEAKKAAEAAKAAAEAPAA